VTIRRLWILLVLAAVFSMHGIGSVSAGPGSAPRPALTAQDGIGVSDGGSTSVQTSDAHRVQPTPASADNSMATGHEVPADDPRHATAEHFLSVCLAVLLAGLTWLVAVAGVRRWVAAVRGMETRPRLDTGWFRPPRPPDLSSLCLLRI
jgi:hypothetical protein